MAPGQSGLDFQVAEPKLFSLVDWLSTRNWFSRWGKHICAGFFTEPRQIGDMVGMSMRKKNELNIQSVAIRKADHFTGISAGIKCRCGTARGVPNKICVNSHPVIVRVELPEAVIRFDFLWMPCPFGQFTKGLAVEAKDRRYALKGRFVEFVLAQLPNYFRADRRFFGQFRIGNPQSALRLSNNVANVVFKWNHVCSILLDTDRLWFCLGAQIANPIQRQFFKRRSNVDNCKCPACFL